MFTAYVDVYTATLLTIPLMIKKSNQLTKLLNLYIQNNKPLNIIQNFILQNKSTILISCTILTINGTPEAALGDTRMYPTTVIELCNSAIGCNKLPELERIAKCHALFHAYRKICYTLKRK